MEFIYQDMKDLQNGILSSSLNTINIKKLTYYPQIFQVTFQAVSSNYCKFNTFLFFLFLLKQLAG